MGKYDVIDRVYFGEENRAAELLSKGVHRGGVEIMGDDLVKTTGEYSSFSRASGSYKRDLFFLCKKYRVMYAVELENYADLGMSRRIMTYDVCEYEKQTEQFDKQHLSRKDYVDFEERKSRIKRGDIYYPVVTVVLYLGEGHWRGNRSLKKLFGIPRNVRKQFASKVGDYKFTLLEIDSMNPEDYQTDLRQFIKAMHCRKDRERLKKLFEQEEFSNLPMDAQKTIAVHLGIKELIKVVVEEETNMCKAWRDLIRDERAEARKEGEKQGEKRGEKRGEINGMVKIISDYIRQTKCTVEEAMDIFLVSEENRKKILSGMALQK